MSWTTVRPPVAILFTALVTTLLMGTASPALAADAPEMEVAKLTASDGDAGDFLGWSVAVSGDTAVVGAFEDEDNGARSGAAYVYVRNGASWLQQAKLTPTDAVESQVFGESVAISGDTVVIGAPGDRENGNWSGAAYIFTRVGTSWTQQAKLVASDGNSGGSLGGAVAISGDTALIGAHLDEPGGSAYVYQRTGTTWVEQAKLTPSSDTFAMFGLSVAVSGDVAVVGAPGDLANGTYSGSVYVFARTDTTWTQQSKLAPSDPGTGDWFGDTVAMAGDTVVVGAADNSTNGSRAGAAYVFTRSGSAWTQQTRLTPSDIADGDRFGRAVAVSGDTAVITAIGDDDNGDWSGSAYVFTRSGTTWTEQTKLRPSDGAAGDQFGVSVGLSGDTAVIGAPDDDDNGSRSGSAYVFTPAPEVAAGNVLAVSGSFVTEYTPDGQRVHQIPVPYPGDGGSNDVRDVVHMDDGRIVVYNGTFEAVISVYEPGAGPWTHYEIPGLSSGGNVSYGGLAVHDNYAFATDQSTGGGTERGVVRVDLDNGDFVRFAESLDPIDLNIGSDGLLYVLSSGAGEIDAFDPDTLGAIRTVNPAPVGDARAVAVNASGQIFLATWAGELVRMDPSGTVEITESPFCRPSGDSCSFTDINITPDGTVLTANRSGGIHVLDQDLNVMKLIAANASFVGGGSAPAYPRLNIASDVSLKKADHIGDVAFTADDVTLDCRGRSIIGTGTEPVGVWVVGVSGVQLRNCHIAGFETGVVAGRTSDSQLVENTVDAPVNGFVLGGESSAIRLLLDHNTVNDATSTGFVLDLDSEDIELIGNTSVDAVSHGFHVRDAYNASLTDNVAIGGAIGYLIDQGSEQIILSHNVARNSSTFGYRVWFAGATALNQNSYAGSGQDDVGFSTAGSWSSGVILTGNSAVDAKTGFDLGGSDVVVAGNSASDSVADGFLVRTRSGQVSDNESVKNGGNGFSFLTNSGLSIEGNLAGRNAGAGFEFHSNTNSQVSNNAALANEGAGFSLIASFRQQGYDNTLFNNTATRNGGDGFNGSSFGQRGDLYEGNTSRANAGYGFVTGSNAVVGDNLAERNGSSGFKIDGADLVIGNTAVGNRVDGFELSSARSGIENNVANKNKGVGFDVSFLENPFINNEGCGNHDTDFFYQPSELFEGASIEENTFCHSVAFALVISDEPDRSTVVSSMAVLPDEAYIYLAQLDPSSDAMKVTFTLDGVVTNVDESQPWDLIGGTEQQAEPLIALAIDEGGHGVEAVVDFKGKRESLIRTIGIYVEHPVSPPMSPPMSPPANQVLNSIHAAIVPLMTGPLGVAMTALLVLVLVVVGVRRGAGALDEALIDPGEQG